MKGSSWLEHNGDNTAERFIQCPQCCHAWNDGRVDFSSFTRVATVTERCPQCGQEFEVEIDFEE